MIQENDNNPVNIFYHIGNTGGGALYEAIIKQYSAQEVIHAI